MSRFALCLTIGAVIGLAAGTSLAQGPSFSIDFQGPTISLLDSWGMVPITESEILVPPFFIPMPGPMPPPAAAAYGGSGPPPPGPDLGLALWPMAVGHPPGVPGRVEVDALSYGKDFNFSTGEPFMWAFSVDEWAVGFAGFPAPDVASEGAAGNQEASADIFADSFIGPGPIGPPPAGFANPNVAIFDGDGLPPFGGFGVGLIEPNPPAPGPVDLGDNMDALDIDTETGGGYVPFPVYFSLDASFLDPLEDPAGLVPINTASAVAHGFVGGDVIVSQVPGGPPVLYAAAGQLGLDIINGPDTDDLDALILWDNGDGAFQPSMDYMDWLMGGTTDMLLFSVRRGSAVIGAPDSYWFMPIEEGDILTTPLGGGGITTPFPGIVIPAELLGLATVRSGMGVVNGDDLNAADNAIDCNGNQYPDWYDIATGTSRDCNGNGTPDECEWLGNLADLDGDKDVDGLDFMTFSGCFNGALRPIKPGCANMCADFNGDNDVDGLDFMTFSSCFNGSLRPPKCP